jgi:hypothetical protein
MVKGLFALVVLLVLLIGVPIAFYPVAGSRVRWGRDRPRKRAGLIDDNSSSARAWSRSAIVNSAIACTAAGLPS